MSEISAPEAFRNRVSFSMRYEADKRQWRVLMSDSGNSDCRYFSMLALALAWIKQQYDGWK